MGNLGSRLARLEQAERERQHELVIQAVDRLMDSPTAAPLLDELVKLASAETAPPPTSWPDHPVLVQSLAEETAEKREGKRKWLWQVFAVAETDRGRVLVRELFALAWQEVPA